MIYTGVFLQQMCITEAFLNEILVLMELIFIRDGSFDIAGNDASLYSRDDIICPFH